ncbi:MAG: pseudouridine synthase [Minisyncoccales bacterium]|jgi:pseudouridine synthase
MKVKLQKYIADSGYSSRRRAEELIKEKKVQVNGKLATIGMRVDEEDTVVVEGKRIRTSKKDRVYILLNKPKGYTCTNREIPGEKNVFSLVSPKERLFVVGRLDKNSRGLVILTNDGDFTYKMTHPSFACEKEYKVELGKEVGAKIIEGLKKGVDIGEKSVAKILEIEKISPKRYKIVMTEGKRRQIRRMFEAFGRTVTDLQRVRIDRYRLGRLKEGEWKQIKL